MWDTTCLRTERREGSTKQAGRPVGGVIASRSQSPNCTARGESRGELRQSKRRIREVGQEA